MSLVPHHWNPSLWISEKHEGLFVLRVPKDHQKEVAKRLNERLWFSGKKWMWFLRKKRKK